jgi:hypothetical protein
MFLFTLSLILSHGRARLGVRGEKPCPSSPFMGGNEREDETIFFLTADYQD